MLTVKALRAGYHGKLREPGEVFEIAGRRELGSWMEPLAGRRRPAARAPAEPASAEPPAEEGP